MSIDGINFTIKEMLAQIDAKITDLGHKLDTKADRTTVHELKADLAALSMEAVRKSGPIAAQIQANSSRLGALERELDRRKGLVDTIADKADLSYVNGIRAELHEISEALQAVQRRLVTFAFSVALSAVGVALTIVLTVGRP